MQGCQVSFCYSRLASAKFMLHPFIGRRFPLQVDADKGAINAVFTELIDQAQKFGQKIDRLITLTTDRISQYDRKIQPYLDKISNRDKLQSLQQEIADEQSVVEQINELEQTLAATNSAIVQEYDKIIEAYSRLLESYNKVVTEINSKPDYSEISAEKKIKLKAQLDFDTQRFAGACTSFVNKQSYFFNIFGAYFDGNNNYIFDKDTHAENFKDIFNKILDPAPNNIRFNQGGTTQNITTSLFDDYFSVSYELSQGGEDILRMSPGKKGMILLFLILHLSNADYPILIDQPEDNLDIRLRFTAKKQGLEMSLNPAEMVFDYDTCSTQTPEAYETLLLDAMRGDATLYMRSDQVEEAWDVITPILEAWESRDSLDFPNYAAGTWGPESAEALIARQGHIWALNLHT